MATTKSRLKNLEQTTAAQKLTGTILEEGRIKEAVLLFLQLFYICLFFFNNILFSILKYFLLTEQKPVREKIVLITGSGKGLGRELSLEFAKLGSKVICVDIDRDINTEIVDTINRLYSTDAKGYVANVVEKDQLKRVADEIENDFSRVDIVISNATIAAAKSLLETDEIELESVLNVNLISQFRLIRRFLPGMLKRDDGHIVIVSDVLSLTATQNGAAHSASKWGTNGLLESLQEELRKIPENNVKISLACPYFLNYTDAVKMRVPELDLSTIARSIVDGIRRNERVFTVPRYAYYYFILLKLLPDDLSDRLKDIFYVECTK